VANALRLRILPLIALLAVPAGTACRKTTPAPPETTTARGGALVASLRSEPGNYSRYFEPSAAADLMSQLTQARLIRINRAADVVEPALAQSWQQTSDGTSLTLHLRKDITFSDGVPFTSADVLFSFAVAYDAPGSVLGESVMVAGKKIAVTAPDVSTVVLTFASPFATAVRILDNLPMLPRHKLEAAFRGGTIQKAWTPATPLTEIVGLGPFVLTEHVSGQRLVFTRNPRYWRRDGQHPLPYLDKLMVEIIRDQNAEALRVESGNIDVMSNGDIRPDDYARFKRAADQGRLRLVDGGIGLDPDLLWFNLRPKAGKDPKPWLRKKEFRQALSYGVDRQALVNTVYLGAAVPIYGPVTPRNATWLSPAVPTYPHDPAKARQLLASAGLTDRNADGMLEDGSGSPARFSILLQQGHTIRERTVALLQEQFRQLGITADVVGLDLGGMGKRWQTGDYESIFHGFQASATDPAMNLDFWLSSGSIHVWNPAQKAPATEWENRIDELMRQQAAAMDLSERKRAFAEVQRIFGEELPALYFVAPKMTLAISPRVANAAPAPQIPQILWSADTLAVARPAAGR
jgi:peptide/nickel transport system substrate-binding protein